MPRNAANASVTDIEVEVERPVDRGAKQADISGAEDSVTQSISGSGGSGTLVENSSQAPWYLEGVTFAAPSSAVTEGVVTVKLEVKNATGDVQATYIADLLSSQIDIGGYPMLRDWTLDYSVTQSDASSYDIDIYPIIRKPEPGTESSGTVTESSVIDGFEHNDLASFYTGDTGSYSITKTGTYRGTYRLQTQNSSDFAEILSVSNGLQNYPGKGDEWEGYALTTDVQSSPVCQSQILFGVADTNNYYRAYLEWDDFNDFFLEKVESGSSTRLDTDNLVDIDYQEDAWHKLVFDWGDDDTISVDLYEPGTSTVIGSVSATDDSHAGNTGIGFRAQTNVSGGTLAFDNFKLR